MALTEIQKLKISIHKLEKQKKYAFALYYRSQQELLEENIEKYNHIEQTVKEIMPPFVKNQLIKLMEDLKKKIDCPICLSTLDPQMIKFSSCGHMYCENCIDKVKQLKKCAICRKTIW